MSGSFELTKEELWRRRLERFEDSDFTVAEFCRVEGVSIPSFYQWRRRLASSRTARAVGRRDDNAIAGRFRTAGSNQPKPANRVNQASETKPCETAAAFVPVRLTQATAVEVQLPNGTRVCLPTGDADLLRVAIEAAGRLGVANPAEATSC